MGSTGFVRKIITGVGVTFAAVAVAALPAGAATAQPAANDQVTAKGMTFYDDFWTLGECKEVGEWGLDHGKWTVYDCQESWVDWDLYVDS